MKVGIHLMRVPVQPTKTARKLGDYGPKLKEINCNYGFIMLMNDENNDKMMRCFYTLIRVYGQFSIETIHERRKRNREFSAYSNRKTKCQNYSKISRN